MIGAAQPDTTGFDLRSLPPGFCDDPYPWYDALRARAPVLRLADGGVLLTRYADVSAVYLDQSTYSSDKRAQFAPKFGAGRLFRHHTTSLVFNDPPDHGRVRKLIVGALLPRAIRHREQDLKALVVRLLDRMDARGGGDLIADFAGAIPVEVIGDLLQIPAADRGPLRGWSLAILGALEPSPSLTALADGETALAGFHDYLEGLVAERRRRPRDVERDILSRLIRGVGDDRLTHEELLENCIFLLNAGHETTTNLIGNLLEALWRFPDQRARVHRDPEAIGGCVEEGLRFESSNQLGNRVTTTAVVLGGVTLAAGTQVTLCIGAANRDPEAFEEPNRFEVGRTPNRHLAFGGGPHQCAGLNLARLEARVAVGALVARYPDYRILAGAERTGRARFRGFKTLPVELQPRP
jgi:cytochrome P450